VESLAKEQFDNCDENDKVFKKYQRERNVQVFERLKEIKPFWKIVLMHLKTVQENLSRDQSYTSDDLDK
jgi:hypothetical protein